MNLDRVIAVRNAKTIFRDGEKCVKVFNENYSKADILNEALNQARIEETGLHIPKILGVTMSVCMPRLYLLFRMKDLYCFPSKTLNLRASFPS